MSQTETGQAGSANGQAEGGQVESVNRQDKPVTAAAVVMMLNVEDIRLPDITNVRPFSKQDSEKELASINALMQSIEQEGQLQPIVVMPIKDSKPGEPRWDIVAGRRRLKAITMLNLSSDKPKQIKAIVGDAAKNMGQLFRRAFHENSMRENLTAIEFAYDIKTARENMKLTGGKGTDKLAKFFGCSEAQISQHEKLLGLDEMFQQAIADGRLRSDGAFALVKVAKDKRLDVYERAMKKQKAELGEGAILQVGWDDELVEGSTPSPSEPSKKKNARKSGAAKSGGVKSKHVQDAAREVDPTVKTSRSRKEILDYFAGQMGPANGYEDGAVHMFCANLIKYAKGEIQERTLDKYFMIMTEKAPRGTAPVKTDKSDTAKTKK